MFGAGINLGVDAQPGLDEGSGQPGPDGALVIGGGACGGFTLVLSFIFGVAGGQRAQSEGRPKAFLDGFDEYNRVIREVARETGTLLIEAANEIPGDSKHFADSVHFTETGCRALARLVVEALASSAELRRLIDSRTS